MQSLKLYNTPFSHYNGVAQNQTTRLVKFQPSQRLHPERATDAGKIPSLVSQNKPVFSLVGSNKSMQQKQTLKGITESPL